MYRLIMRDTTATSGSAAFYGSQATDTDGNVIRAMKRHPTLEDRVVVYANATILGGQTCVGHDAVIGSSVWLTEGVAPHTTVLLEKPKLRLRSESPTGLEPEISYQI